MIFNKIKYGFTFLILAAIAGACSYSFTGASVPPHLQTIAIPLFQDRSGSGEPNLGNDFTDELIQKFINDNNLEVTDRTNSDAVLECTILSLNDTPEAVSTSPTGQSEKATLRKLTITVKVLYRDLVKKATVIDKNFSNYATYDANNFVEARQEAIQTAIENITEDILLAVVSDW